jgi:DNA-binding MarR family transcriptional regulator
MTQSKVKKLKVYESPNDVKIRTWTQLARTFLLVQKSITTVITEHGLTLPQFDVLATLRFSEGATQQELSAKLLVTKGNVCGLLNRLEDAGWVERRPDPVDARVNRLHLTAAGRRKIEVALPRHDGVVGSLLAKLTTPEVVTLRRLLRQVEIGLGRE